MQDQGVAASLWACVALWIVAVERVCWYACTWLIRARLTSPAACALCNVANSVVRRGNVQHICGPTWLWADVSTTLGFGRSCVLQAATATAAEAQACWHVMCSLVDMRVTHLLTIPARRMQV